MPPSQQQVSTFAVVYVCTASTHYGYPSQQYNAMYVLSSFSPHSLHLNASPLHYNSSLPSPFPPPPPHSPHLNPLPFLPTNTKCGEAFAAKIGSPSSREKVPLAEEAFQLTIQSLCQSSLGDVFTDQEEVQRLSEAYHTVRACLVNTTGLKLLRNTHFSALPPYLLTSLPPPSPLLLPSLPIPFLPPSLSNSPIDPSSLTSAGVK